MAETLWSCNRTCTCMYTLCVITVDFQASEQTKLHLRDETKWSDVTLGLWYMGLMRSASVGGACVSECEDGLQMAQRRRDLWMNSGEHVGQQTGRGKFSYGQLMADCSPCLWMDLLASMVRNCAGPVCTHTHTRQK